MQVHALTQERDQERLPLESIVSTRDKQHQEVRDTLATHLQHYEEEEQKFAEDHKVLRTEWDEWSSDQAAELAAATQCPAPLPAQSSVAEQQPTQFQPWTLPPLQLSLVVGRLVKSSLREPSAQTAQPAVATLLSPPFFAGRRRAAALSLSYSWTLLFDLASIQQRKVS